LYIPQAIAAFTLIVGQFHAEPCGMKELCIIQIVCKFVPVSWIYPNLYCIVELG
jgi:hypothetical protein